MRNRGARKHRGWTRKGAKAAIEQRHHLEITRPRRGAAHNHPDQTMVIANGRRDDVETGGIHIAGLHPVSARVLLRDMVEAVKNVPAIEKRMDIEKMVVLRVGLDDGQCKSGHIAGGGPLVGVR